MLILSSLERGSNSDVLEFGHVNVRRKIKLL